MSRNMYVSKADAMVADPREEKLPAWAHHTIAALRRGVTDAEASLAAHIDTLEPTQVFYYETGSMSNRIYLPERASVHWDFAGQGKLRDSIRVSWHRDRMRVQGGQGISILPQASNAFDLKFAPR